MTDVYRNKISKGQGLVEFALILPILLIMVLGAIDLGRLFFSSIVVQNASRAGARHGIDILFPLLSTNVAAKESEIKTVTILEARNSNIQLLDTYVTVNCDGNTALNSGCSSSSGCFCVSPSNQNLRVTVRYPFRFITLFFIDLPMTIVRFTEMKIQ